MLICSTQFCCVGSQYEAHEVQESSSQFVLMWMSIDIKCALLQIRTSIAKQRHSTSIHDSCSTLTTVFERADKALTYEESKQ